MWSCVSMEDGHVMRALKVKVNGQEVDQKGGRKHDDCS